MDSGASVFRRTPLLCLPTPFHRLDRVSADYGADVWIKRDDLTGFAGGGNKGRKLEYIATRIQAAQITTVVCEGSTQSNFIRQLGATCRVLGVRCVAVVMDYPYEFSLPPGPLVPASGGNLILGEILGIDFRRGPNGTWDELRARAEATATEEANRGERVWHIPVGGSVPEGAAGFLAAAHELVAQSPEPIAEIWFASASGSTHVGLQTALLDTSIRVQGVATDPEPGIAEEFAELSERLHRADSSLPVLSASEFRLTFDFVGPGYGVPSEAGAAATEYLARREGIFLDPIYTAKAFAALRDRLSSRPAEGRPAEGRIVFWHTGGFPSLFGH